MYTSVPVFENTHFRWLGLFFSIGRKPFRCPDSLEWGLCECYSFRNRFRNDVDRSDSFFLDICSLKKDAVLMTSNEYCDYKNNHLNQLQPLTYQISASFCLTSHLFNFSLSSKWWIQSSSATCGKTKNQREKQESLTANFLRLNLWGKTSGPL